MDVRAAGTSDLAVKRLEMEHVQPIKERHGSEQDKNTLHTGVDAHNPLNKVGNRDPKEKQGKQSEGDESRAEQNADGEGRLLDASVSTVSGDEHILDVKV